MKVWVTTTVAFAAIAVAFACYWYSQWWDRIWYLRWTSSRVEALSSLGERIRAYTTGTDGAFPQTWKELVEAGILAKREIEFEDAVRCVRVTRTLRPVPSIYTQGDPIVVAEAYGLQSGEGCALYLSGKALWEFDIRHAIKLDNRLRRELGLAELNFREGASDDP